MKPFVFLVAVLSLFAISLQAQVAAGIYPMSTNSNQGFDTINIGNLNVHFSIPVFSKQGRGGLGFYYNLAYDSSVWTPVGASGSQTWQPAVAWGWTADTDAVTGYFTYSTIQKKCFDTPPTWYWTTYSWNFYYVDPFGQTHYFPGQTSDCSSYGSSQITVTASDGSGYTLSAGTTSFSIQSPNGKTSMPPLNTTGGTGLLTDANGNQLSTTSSGITDTTGTTVLTFAGSGTPSSPRTYTYPVWESPTSGVTSEAVTVNYQSYNVQTNFGCSGISEYSASSVSLASSVVLADGEQYTFSYEQTPGTPGKVTGRLASITLPTGGVITYSYSGGSNGIVCADGGVATLQRGITIPSSTSWTYTRTPGSTEATTHTDVVDGLSNHASYDFVSDPTDDPTHKFYLTNKVQNQGASSQLLAAATCYNSATAPCTTQSLTLPITKSTTKTTLNSSVTAETDLSLNTHGQITEEDDYDFGTGSPGGLIRKVQTGYGPLSNGMSVLEDAITWDGNGHELSGLDYNYDETAVQSTSGLPKHVSVSGAREPDQYRHHQPASWSHTGQPLYL